MTLPSKATIYEVGPRDGLQNVAQQVATEAKVAFVDALSAAGLTAIEVTSFVSPKVVPQLADGADVMARISQRPGVRYPVLVPNDKGLDAALQAGAREVAVFTAASEAFSKRNVNASVADSLDRFRPVARRTLDAGLRLRGYVSTAFGCPFQGDVPIEDVVLVVQLLADLGCHEISVGDTIGVADPAQVRRVVDALGARFDLAHVALHMHDTWGRALANVLAGLQSGITIFDASAGGLGGCPFAPGATGNVATEDVVDLLHRMGISTGVDLERLVDASLALQGATGLSLPSRVLAAVRARRARGRTEGAC
jgi:hydroxymethylglutaryl-CoA lyase